MIAKLQAERDRRSACNKAASFRPYKRQFEHFSAGAYHRERLLMAGNQLGKTYAGAMECSYHLTGRYPDWWPGHRFDRPVEVWAGSDTTETTRDTVQTNLVGPPEDRDAWGTAAIPRNAFSGNPSMRRGTANAIDTMLVRHVSGGNSLLGFKAYDQKRQKWQGTKKDYVWMDEEPPIDIYMEALTRTNAVADGKLCVTFTPLLGMSEVVRMFLNVGVDAKA